MSKKRILLVDDQAIFREPIARALEARGYMVTSAEDGRIALQTLEMQLPDLLILDLSMPKVDGLIVLARIRGNPDWRYLPTIVLTANSDPKVLGQARDLGADFVLLKGQFNLEELYEMVELSLARYEEGGINPKKSSNAKVIRSTGVDLGPVVERGEALPVAGAGPLTGAPLEPRAPETAGGDFGMPQVLEREYTVQTIEAWRGAPLSLQVKESFELPLSQDEQAANAVCELTDRYPELLQRVLDAANSAAFAGSSEYRSLREAIAGLGLSVVRGLLLGCGIIDFFKTEDEDLRELAQRCWTSSLAVFAILSRLHHRPAAVEQEKMILIGLCHELVEQLLWQQFPHDCRRVEAVCESSSASLREIREKTFSLTERELFDLAVSPIKLPNSVLGPVRDYLAHKKDAGSKASGLGLGLILARYLANGLGFAVNRAAELKPIVKDEFLQAIGITPPAPSAFSDLDAVAVNVAGALIPLPNLAQTPCEAVTIARDVKILYVRTKEYALLDPLLFALERRVEVTDRLSMPYSSDDLKGYHGMVICVPHMDYELYTLFHCRRLLRDLEHPQFQILYLSGSGASSNGAGGDDQIAVLPYPLKISRLEAFLSRLRRLQA